MVSIVNMVKTIFATNLHGDYRILFGKSYYGHIPSNIMAIVFSINIGMLFLDLFNNIRFLLNYI